MILPTKIYTTYAYTTLEHYHKKGYLSIMALKNQSGSQLIKNSYVRIQVGKRLNNNDRRRQMAINDFIISTLNVSDDMIFSIDKLSFNINATLCCVNL